MLTHTAPVSESDLIAHALGGARPAERLRQVARTLASIPPWQRRMLGMPQLTRDHGVAASYATRIIAIWELAERAAPDERPAIASPRDALLLLDRLRSLRREEVAAVLLDARHRPMGVETIAVGSVNSSRLQPRDVFGPALRHGSVAVIIGHNHPSGDHTPSRSDRVVTAALRAAGEMLGVAVLDHIIVTRGGHYSFRDSERWELEPGG